MIGGPGLAWVRTLRRLEDQHGAGTFLSAISVPQTSWSDPPPLASCISAKPPNCDGGFKKTFIAHCGAVHISAEVVSKIHAGVFEVLPRRWVVERTWSWLMNNRRLQVDYERLPIVAEGFVWAAHSRLLMRRLTTPRIHWSRCINIRDSL
jgi:hypothetical protein